jgi:transcription termination/antitermination protein NusG
MMGAAMLWNIGDFVEMVDLDKLRERDTPTPALWYALELHPNRDAKVTRTFDQRRINYYFPTITQRKKIVRRRRGYEITIEREVTSPLFPGVVFIPDFQRARGGVLSVDGVSDFWRFGEWVATLPPNEMEKIRTIEAIGKIPLARRKRLYALNQIVRVVDGPFASFNGTIDRLDSKGRLSVLVDLFKRMVPVMLDENQIEAV